MGHRRQRRRKCNRGKFLKPWGIGRTRGPPCCTVKHRGKKRAKGEYKCHCRKCCRKAKGRYPQWGGGLTWVLITNAQWLQSQNNYLRADGSGVF